MGSHLIITLNHSANIINRIQISSDTLEQQTINCCYTVISSITWSRSSFQSARLRFTSLLLRALTSLKNLLFYWSVASLPLNLISRPAHFKNRSNRSLSSTWRILVASVYESRLVMIVHLHSCSSQASMQQGFLSSCIFNGQIDQVVQCQTLWPKDGQTYIKIYF